VHQHAFVTTCPWWPWQSQALRLPGLPEGSNRKVKLITGASRLTMLRNNLAGGPAGMQWCRRRALRGYPAPKGSSPGQVPLVSPAPLSASAAVSNDNEHVAPFDAGSTCREGAGDEGVQTKWDRTLEALQGLITKRHRERLQTDSLEAMQDYLARLELDVTKLKVIHVAGTKGKGSTCTMVESILRSKGLRTALYTSPHLLDVRERIRIDGKMLPKDVFADYFWEVFGQLRETADLPSTKFAAMPGYFRFLTVLAFKIFLAQGVDVAIIEVGLGGRLDATNVVAPQVCGITSLDYDHTNVLGDTLGLIALEKAGILKPAVRSFTVSQHPEALEVLRRRAAEVGSRLLLVPPLSSFRRESADAVQLGLEGAEVQLTNAALAVALVNAFLAPSREQMALASLSAASALSHSTELSGSSGSANHVVGEEGVDHVHTTPGGGGGGSVNHVVVGGGEAAAAAAAAAAADERLRKMESAIFFHLPDAYRPGLSTP
jgi:hypothetical protein